MVSALNRRSALTTYVIPLHIIYKLFKYNNNKIGRIYLVDILRCFMICITLYCRERQQHKISDFYGIISIVSDIIIQLSELAGCGFSF